MFPRFPRFPRFRESVFDVISSNYIFRFQKIQKDYNIIKIYCPLKTEIARLLGFRSNLLRLKNFRGKNKPKRSKNSQDWGRWEGSRNDALIPAYKLCFLPLLYNNFWMYIKQLQRGMVFTNQRPPPMVRSVFQATQENCGHCIPRKTRHEPMGDKIPPHF